MTGMSHMKHLFVAAAVALTAVAGAPPARGQTQPTDPAHPLANPQAPAPDCRSDSMRGGSVPCGATNNTQTNGAPPAQKK